MELKGRLKLIADKIPDCSVVADIGTDHAYLPIYLVMKGICKRAVAADVKNGPILAAQNNILNFGVNDYIDARLGYGLEPIKSREADAVIIAGMGGILIRDIIKNDMGKAQNAGVLILQPMNAPEILRAWLFDNGFEIYDEEMINEGDKIYIVICARYTGNTQKYDEFYNYVGLKLIERKDPLLEKYMDKWIRQLDKAITEMNESNDRVDEIRNKYAWLIKNMKSTKELLKR